jgi:flagellar basal-body rod modification protein FlgD
MSIANVPSSTSSASSNSSSPATSSTPSGFAALTSQDFLKMLITELQNQDPTQPVSNTELLQQLSQMQALQSNVELNSTLTNFSTNQQISSGASFLGKVVSGNDSNQNPVSGVADRVFMQNGTLMIGIGSSSLSVANVTGVSLSSQ